MTTPRNSAQAELWPALPYEDWKDTCTTLHLSLAAAPTFAVMALLTGVLGGGQPDILCSAVEHTSPLSGMVPMYLLMSAFHSAPWLKLVASWQSDARRS